MAEIDTPVGILDSRDLALLVWVTKDGNAQVQAEGCDPAYAGHALRFMADGIDPPADGQTYAKLTDALRTALVNEVVRRAGAPSDELAGALVDIVVEGVFARGYSIVGPAAEGDNRG